MAEVRPLGKVSASISMQPAGDAKSTAYNPKSVIDVPQQTFSALLVGPPGCGKTTMALTAPRPIFVIDIDFKLHQLAHTIDMTGVEFQQFDSAVGGLHKISTDFTFDPSSPHTGYESKARPSVFREVAEIINYFQDIVEAGGELPFRTLVIDTVSRFGDHLEAQILHGMKLRAMTIPAWGEFSRKMKQFISVTVSLPCNVIFCSHDRTVVDDITKEVTVIPHIPGQSSEVIGSYFQEVYYLQPRIERGNGKDKIDSMIVECLTRADKKYAVRSSMTDLVRVPADFRRILAGEFKVKK